MLTTYPVQNVQISNITDGKKPKILFEF